MRRHTGHPNMTVQLPIQSLQWQHNRIIVGGLFCDLQKAFDCVNYDILLSKIKFYGITGVANKLMESYLRNRYQSVIINAHNNSNGYYSKWKEVQHGVPQGSVLALLLQVTMRLNLSSKLMRYLKK